MQDQSQLSPNYALPTSFSNEEKYLARYILMATERNQTTHTLASFRRSSTLCSVTAWVSHRTA